jgi:RimJ/RimL family protein N-acetyltransferase
MTDPTGDWLAAVPLEGAHVRLEQLSHDHVDDLFAAGGGDDDLWRWMPTRPPSTVDDMRAMLENQLAAQRRGHTVPWTVVDKASGRAIGWTTYLDVAPEHRQLEVGWTWYGRAWWRTAVNPECKLLLLGRAFDDLGARRVALKTDHRNVRSQAAIARLGGVREGVLRAHRIRPDGSSRDTVYYSILANEWPGVRERLLERLAAG